MVNPLHFYLSLSIGFAVLIGWIRYKKIDPVYYPFIYDTTIALLIEILVQILMQRGSIHPLMVIVNTYTLVNFCMLTWLFHNWGLFNRNRKTFISILVTVIIAWIGLTVFLDGIFSTNWYFRILYSFILVFFSVSAFNKVVVHDRTPILKNPKFWICLGIIIFYTFFVLVCATKGVFRERISTEFRRGIQEINVYSNLLVNLLYAVAALWIPRKKNFTALF